MEAICECCHCGKKATCCCFICPEPPPCYCDEHYEEFHVPEKNEGQHYPAPLDVLSWTRRKRDELRPKAFILSLNSARLKDDIPSLDSLRRDVEKAFEDLIVQINFWKERHFEAIRRCREEIVQQVNSVIKKNADRLLQAVDSPQTDALESFMEKPGREVKLLNVDLQLEQSKDALAAACALKIETDVARIRTIFVEACDPASESRLLQYKEQLAKAQNEIERHKNAIDQLNAVVQEAGEREAKLHADSVKFESLARDRETKSNNLESRLVSMAHELTSMRLSAQMWEKKYSEKKVEYDKLKQDVQRWRGKTGRLATIAEKDEQSRQFDLFFARQSLLDTVDSERVQIQELPIEDLDQSKGSKVANRYRESADLSCKDEDIEELPPSVPFSEKAKKGIKLSNKCLSCNGNLSVTSKPCEKCQSPVKTSECLECRKVREYYCRNCVIRDSQSTMPETPSSTKAIPSEAFIDGMLHASEQPELASPRNGKSFFRIQRKAHPLAAYPFAKCNLTSRSKQP